MRSGGALAGLILLLSAPSLAAWEPPASYLAAFRESEKLTVPGWSDDLADSARHRAEALARAGVLSHRDDRGRGPGDQMLAEGFPPGEYGEVLGAGRDIREVWSAWLASPSHREVLAEPGWRTWGWASAASGQTRVWVLRFWKP